MSAHDATAGAPESSTRSWVDLREFVQSTALIWVWGLMIAIFAIALGSTFFSWANFADMFSSQTVLLILALGVLLPLTCGDFDLSIASVLSLSSMLVAILNVRHGWAIGPAILVALAAALVVGVVNGLVIVLFDLDSFIVTLGTSTVLAGLVLRLSDSQAVSGVSSTLTDLVIGERLLGVALEFYYGLALCALLWWLFEYSPMGRRMLFVGRGRSVARLNGVRVDRVRILALVGCAVMAGLAGVAFAGTTGGSDPTSGATFLLPAFAAAFLGSTAIRPGRFNPLGTLTAVYFLVTGITGLQLIGVDAYVQQLFYGGALLIAVTVSRVVTGRKAGA
jgi:ribose transport system permease protein